jgi:transcriptional regulator with XRE-family HTH domain
MNGKEIREWREARNLSRKELAELLSVSYAAVANWELDRNAPHGAALDRLVEIMEGKVAVIPLTRLEEQILDEAVARGRFESRHDYLSAGLLEVIRGTLAGRAIDPRSLLKVAEPPADYQAKKDIGA